MVGHKVKKPNKYWWISFNLNSEEFNNFIAEASKIKAHCENDGTYAEISGAEKDYKKIKALCEKFSSEEWYLQSKPETEKGAPRPPDFVIQIVKQDRITAYLDNKDWEIFKKQFSSLVKQIQSKPGTKQFTLEVPVKFEKEFYKAVDEVLTTKRSQRPKVKDVWMFQFNIEDNMEGLCCVRAEDETKAKDIAISTIATQIEQGPAEITESWTLESWERDFDEFLNPEEMPKSDSGIIIDFGT